MIVKPIPVDLFKQSKKEARNGDPEAMHIVGMCYEFGNNVKKNKARAEHWYRKVAKHYILIECDDDYTGLWCIIREVEHYFIKQDETNLRKQVLKILRELLSAKRIKAGYPTKDGKFHSFRLSQDKILAKVKQEWQPGCRPSIGEGTWFTSR